MKLFKQINKFSINNNNNKIFKNSYSQSVDHSVTLALANQLKILKDHGNENVAKEFISRFNTLLKESSNECGELVEKCYKEGKYCETVEICEEIFKTDETDVRLYKLYVDTLLRLTIGGDFKTLEVLHKAVNLFPNEAYFKEKTEEVEILHKINTVINKYY